MSKIKFKGLGLNISVDCEDGASCSEAIEVFERVTQKALKGMEFYSGGKKVSDLSSEAPEELVAVKSKHESASTIKFKGLGLNISVDCEDGASCSEAIEVFERVTQKALKGMEFYSNGRKVSDLTSEAPEELVAVKAKHESAAKIKFKGLGLNISVDCEDGASCEEAIEVFERVTQKALKGMEFYSNGRKVSDLKTEAPEELVAVKSKHESAKQ